MNLKKMKIKKVSPKRTETRNSAYRFLRRKRNFGSISESAILGSNGVKKNIRVDIVTIFPDIFSSRPARFALRSKAGGGGSASGGDSCHATF